MARKMKDSGIEWIGEIPEGWEIRKIKNNFMIYAGATPKSEKAEYWDGGLPWITPADFKTTDKYVSYGRKSLTALGYDSCGSTLVPAGSIIFSKRAPVGSVVIAKNTLCTNQGCLACIPNDAVNSTYFYYCMSIFTEQFELVSAGTTFKEIAASTFASFLLPCPPLSQQNEIVNFLDKESSRIDSMLSKTRSSIEEYKKLKQAVITQAVTKGVRGEREMKDSGNPWFGQIPTDWKLSRVGLHFSIILGKMLCNAPLNDTYTLEPYYCAADVHFDGVADGERKKMWFSPIEKDLYRVSVGDLLVVEGGAGAGGSAIVENQDSYTYIQNSIMIVRSKGNTDNRYLRYLLEFLVKQGYIDIVCNKATIPHFTKDKLSCVPFCLCPAGKQKEIADYLDSKCAEIDGLIAKKEQLVKELESYKKSLIYEVVTGKREV